MARKVLNRKELREENDAAEREAKPKKKEKVVKTEEEGGVKKKPTKRKSRAKTTKEVRLKAFWGVFNQSMKRVALFEYSQRKQAEKKALELSTSAKTPHFIQPVKEVIEEQLALEFFIAAPRVGPPRRLADYQANFSFELAGLPSLSIDRQDLSGDASPVA